MEPLKNLLNAQSIADLGHEIAKTGYPLNVSQFVADVLADEWTHHPSVNTGAATPTAMVAETKAARLVSPAAFPASTTIHTDATPAVVRTWETTPLKQRITHLARVLGRHLPTHYQAATEILKAASHAKHINPMVYLAFPTYIELFGQQHWQHSMETAAAITHCSTCEFAVRPFIAAHPQKAFNLLQTWAVHPSAHIRRLASEGCRPLLPWATRLPFLVADPTPVFDVLTLLKADNSKYVQKSVANNLNDITKHNPEKVLAWCARYWQQHPTTDWIIKRGLRTLVKHGHPKATQLVGLHASPNVHVSAFTITPTTVHLGGSITLSTTLQLPHSQSLRIGYAVDYKKKNGTHSRKIFHWQEATYPAGTYTLRKTQTIKNLSTRVHHAGTHPVHLLINGTAVAECRFQLQT